MRSHAPMSSRNATLAGASAYTRESHSAPGAAGTPRSISASLRPVSASAAARLAPTSPAPTMMTSNSIPNSIPFIEAVLPRTHRRSRGKRFRSTYHPESKGQPGKVKKRVLRMIGSVEILGRKDQQPSRNHVDHPGHFPELVGILQPVVPSILYDPGILPRRLRVRFVHDERV